MKQKGYIYRQEKAYKGDLSGLRGAPGPAEYKTIVVSATIHSVGLTRRTAQFASDKLPAYLSQHQSGRKAGQSCVKVLTKAICAHGRRAGGLLKGQATIRGFTGWCILFFQKVTAMPCLVLLQVKAAQPSTWD